MDDDFDDFEPWTTDGAARLRAAAADLVAALTAHAEAVAGASGGAEFVAVLEANERLLPVVVAYADAQFDYTGNFGLFGGLEELDEDDDGPDEDDDEQDSEPITGFSVLERRDYAVTDESAVLAAGRRAYADVWPDDSAEAAAADVTHLGRALYQVAHANGWHALGDVEGLEPRAALVAVVGHDELLGGDSREWPEVPTIQVGELLYEQRDSYH